MKKWIILISIILGTNLCILLTGAENIFLCILALLIVDFMIIGEFYIDFYHKENKKDE